MVDFLCTPNPGYSVQKTMEDFSEHSNTSSIPGAEAFFNNYKKQQQQLLEAAKKGRKDEVIDLLRKRTYINCKDMLGNSPLMWAIHFGKLIIPKLTIT